MPGQTTVVFPLGQAKAMVGGKKKSSHMVDREYAEVSAVVDVPVLGQGSETGVVYATLCIIGLLVLTGFVLLIVPLFLIKPSP